MFEDVRQTGTALMSHYRVSPKKCSHFLEAISPSKMAIGKKRKWGLWLTGQAG